MWVTNSWSCLSPEASAPILRGTTGLPISISISISIVTMLVYISAQVANLRLDMEF